MSLSIIYGMLSWINANNHKEKLTSFYCKIALYKIIFWFSNNFSGVK